MQYTMLLLLLTWEGMHVESMYINVRSVISAMWVPDNKVFHQHTTNVVVAFLYFNSAGIDCKLPTHEFQLQYMCVNNVFKLLIVGHIIFLPLHLRTLE